MRSRLLVSLLFLCTLSACKKVTNITEVYAPARVVTLDSAAITVYPGDMRKVTALLSSPLDVRTESLSWETSSPTTATVESNGTIRAIAPGYALITVYLLRDGGKTQSSATVQVTVLQRPVQKVVTITASPLAGTLFVGDSLQALAAVSTSPDSLSKAVTWRALNPSVATVTNSGRIHAVAVGTASIVVTSVADTTKSVTVSITVNAKAPPTGNYVRSLTPVVSAVALKFNRDTVVAVTVVADAGVDRSYTCVTSNAALVQIVDQATCRFRLVAAYPTSMTNVRIIYTAKGPGVPTVNGGVVSSFITVTYSP